MTDGYRQDENARPTFVQSYRKLGRVKFWSLMVAIFAYAAIDLWLDDEVGWPDNFGFHCLGRGCLFVEAWHSPALLHHPTPYELALFVWIWLLPILFLGVVIYFGIRKLRGMNFSFYDDDDEARR